ncbi:junctional adhesion molecule-like isoform X1 [Alligator mississippiensis]|uniref:junctional adhesion molecule-like isoform X1 n=2 Tax=Alligator mississippiensis TaxID=8496 RepID=UPI0028776484|nr:junctional adhesion molecule-like isoform X1 [Alligator mississippiensis]
MRPPAGANWSLSLPRRMSPSLALVLMLAALGSIGALDPRVFTCPELRAHVGASVLLECFLLVPGDGAWTVTKVDWVHTPRNSTESEVVVFYYYSGHGVPAGPARERVRWLGDVSHGNGSIGLQDVQEGDGGTYTCEIRVSGHSSIFKNRTALHVVPAARRRSWAVVTVGPMDPESAGGSEGGSSIVGYVCAAVGLVLALLLALGLVLRTRRSAETKALAKSWEDGSKSKAEKSIYSSIHGPGTPKAVCEAEQSSKAEATYVTMRPVAAFPRAGTMLLDDSTYINFMRKTIPAEWRQKGLQSEGETQGSRKAGDGAACLGVENPCAVEAGCEPEAQPGKATLDISSGEGQALPTPPGCCGAGTQPHGDKDPATC